MGIIFDVQDKAEAIVEEMKNTVSTVLEETASIEEKPTVMIVEFLETPFPTTARRAWAGIW